MAWLRGSAIFAQGYPPADPMPGVEGAADIDLGLRRPGLRTKKHAIEFDRISIPAYDHLA